MPAADSLIIEHAHIRTLDEQRPLAQAMAIVDGIIAAVGDSDDVRPYKTRGVRVLDASGATVIPGFIDTHVHYTLTGLTRLALDLGGVTRLTDALDQLSAFAGRMPARALVVASGYQPEAIDERRFPTPAEMDQAAGGRPVYVMERGGHWCAVNAAAYALLTLDADASPMPANGVLTEAVNMAAFTQLWQRYKFERGVGSAFQAAAALAVQGGVTTVHALDDLEDVEALLRAAPDLPIAFVPYTQSHDVAAVQALGLRQIGGCGMVSVDGDFGPRTAALLEPYSDAPTHGTLNFGDDELAGYVDRAHRAGMQVALHAVGSGAIEQLLTAFERALARTPRANHRHRVEHFELPAPGQAERAHAMGVQLALQPSFNRIWPHHEDYPRMVGADRALQIDPVASVFAAGHLPAFGSDSPVTPLAGLHWLISAVQHSNPAQRISAAQALAACTRSGAYFGFEEAHKGQLRPGMRGDCVLLSADPLSADAVDLAAIVVRTTISAGRVVYTR